MFYNKFVKYLNKERLINDQTIFSFGKIVILDTYIKKIYLLKYIHYNTRCNIYA